MPSDVELVSELMEANPFKRYLFFYQFWVPEKNMQKKVSPQKNFRSVFGAFDKQAHSLINTLSMFWSFSNSASTECSEALETAAGLLRRTARSFTQTAPALT